MAPFPRPMLHNLTQSKIYALWGVIALAGAMGGWAGYHLTEVRMTTELLDDTRRCAVAIEPAELREFAGRRSDTANARYPAIKRRLMSLRQVNVHVRFVYVFRFVPETGKVIFLCDSAEVGAKDESLPGDDYPQAATSPGLQQIITNGMPAVEGPLRDDFGEWITGYALISEVPSAKPGVPMREILGMDVDAAEWSREVWFAALQWASYIWTLLGMPFVAVLMLRRQLEQREAIRNLSEAMEQSHSALMIVDLESCIEYANRGLCRQIGYSRRELIGRNWRDFQVAETSPEVIAELVSTVRSGHSWEGQWFNRRKDGTVYPVRGVVTPVRDRAGQLSCFIAAFDDVTEVRRREAELREARDLAQAGDRAKGQFLATMSHEVRTPLNGIVGFTNLLLDTPLSAEQRDYVQTIRTSGEALIQLTGDILDFARIESGKLALESASCDPRECVEEALDLLAATAANKGIELLHWIDDEVPASVLTDGGRLRQVLVNFVNNAVKFTEQGSVDVAVRLATAEEKSRHESHAATTATGSSPAAKEDCVLAFTVRDTGIGIPADQHDKLFKPFSQVDASTTRKFGGTGLGLAICRNLINLMGGEVAFTSEPGRGSTFSFVLRFPIASPARPAPDLAGLRLALVARPGLLRSELARLAGRWRAQLTEAESVAALKGSVGDITLVEIDEAYARTLAAPGAAPLGLPVARTFGVVPISLSSEARVALRAHFRLLVNKPVHHDALYALLRGVRPSAAPVRPPVHFELNVLLVEDNPVNQRLMQKVLTNLGCRWTATLNGREAVQALATAGEAFDAVIMDLHMPEMDGMAAIAAIRAGEAGLRAKTVWIVALTADARDDQRERALTTGANDYLTKPLITTELEASFRRCREVSGWRSGPA